MTVGVNCCICLNGISQKLYEGILRKLLSNRERGNMCNFSPNQIRSRVMGWARHVARTGESSKAYNILVPKTEWKKLLRRTRRIILKCIFEKQGVRIWDGFIWIWFTWRQGSAFADAVMNIRVP
jgi:hypothetical protein